MCLIVQYHTEKNGPEEYEEHFYPYRGRVILPRFTLQQDGGRCWHVERSCHGFCLHVHVHRVSNDKHDRGKYINCLL